MICLQHTRQSFSSWHDCDIPDSHSYHDMTTMVRDDNCHYHHHYYHYHLISNPSRLSNPTSTPSSTPPSCSYQPCHHPPRSYSCCHATIKSVRSILVVPVILTDASTLEPPGLTGYGSCEVAGDDAVALSYVIAATRPIGGILLSLLLLALLKPVILGVIG